MEGRGYFVEKRGFWYIREMNHSYMVYENNIDETDYEVQMILHNQISGLLSCKMKKVDGKALLQYDISSKQSLKNAYEKKKMDYIQISKLFSDLRDVIKKTEDYLLSMEHLAIDPELIYMDIESLEFEFCLIPAGWNKADGFQKLMEFILDSVDYTDEKAVAVAYELYKKTAVENFLFEKVYEDVFCRQEKEINSPEQKVEQRKESTLINHGKISEKKYNEDMEEEYPYPEKMGEEKEIKRWTDLFKVGKLGQKLQEVNIREIIFVVIVVIIAIIAIVCLVLNIQTNLMIKILAVDVIAGIVIGYKYYNKNKDEDGDYLELDFEDYEGEEVQYGDLGEAKIQKETLIVEESKEENSAEEAYGATEFFCSESVKEIRVLRPKSGTTPELHIEIFPYIIGKMRGAVDGVITHDTVSRIHCKIEYLNDEYYIMDLNSTNGTALNGELLNSNEKNLLNIGDEIRMGQVVYMFQ